MDSTYAGKYGNLKAASLNLLDSEFLDKIDKKDIDEFLPTLGQTSYRSDIDKIVKMYKIPDSIEVIINTHMVEMLSQVYMAVPPTAKNFIYAYMSRWDVENIKVILSSKLLNYDVEAAEVFLVLGKNVPVSMLGGTITAGEYRDILGQKSVEDVVNSLMKFGYGKVLMSDMDGFRKTGDISGMMLSLDMYYYDNILKNFRFYNGNEGPVIGFMRDRIDAQNILSVIKAINFGYKNPKGFMIKGGNLKESMLNDMLSGNNVDMLKRDIPFDIGEAFEEYKKDPSVTYFDSALRRSIYSKYLKIFDSSSMSLAYIMWFILRCEIERDELRAIWFSKYYGISRDRLGDMMMLKHMEN